ncbi:MAG: YtxH domain-containing protein [Armatimonadota bacterium]|jgi:gas vesicle protein
MSDNSNDKNVTLNFLAGMGVGALVGAVTALLLAPKSGKETRDDIKVAADELKQKAEKAMHDLSESGEDLVKKSKEILESTKAKVQQAIDAGKQVVAKGEECEEPELAEEGEC